MRQKCIKRQIRITVIGLVRLFQKRDVEQVSLQLAAENAKRRFRSDAGRQCIPDSGGHHREILYVG